MEPEESRADAPEPESEATAPRARSPRSRKPRSVASAATPTTAARRTPRASTSTGVRPNGSRSAATGSQRRPRTAPVPPEERVTAADALVELPDPPVEDVVVEDAPVEEALPEDPPIQQTPIVESAVDEAPVERVPADRLHVIESQLDETPVVETPVVEAPVDEVRGGGTPDERVPSALEDFAGDEDLDGVDDPVGPSDPVDAPAPASDDPEAREELAALVAEQPEAAPVDPRELEPEPAVASAFVEAAPVTAVRTPAAHELVTEPSADADRAATDAFSDIVGARPEARATGARIALELRGLRKRFGSVTAVDGVDLVVPAGSFFGVVGPNGAGKTTTLSMITGLLRPDQGSVSVYGHDVWTDSEAAKRALGVLPDRLRLFDRLTGAQLLAYTGSLRGMERDVIVRRTRDLAAAFGLTGSLGRPVADYSLGMTKKIAIAAALLHAPRMLVLDEPFESVDPVSAAAVLAVLRRFTESGGTVVLSSHSMELIESACDRLAIIAEGRILAEGTTADVLSGVTLEDRFVELAGGRSAVEGMEWLHSYTDE